MYRMYVMNVNDEAGGPRIQEVGVAPYGRKGDECALYRSRLYLHGGVPIEGGVGDRRIELALHLRPVAVVGHAQVDVARHHVGERARGGYFGLAVVGDGPLRAL